MGPGGEGRAPGLWAPQRRALTTGLVLTITFVASEALAVVTVMPVVARDLGGLRLYGWVFSAFMLGSVVGIVAAGREADRRGPAVPFVAGVVLFGSGLAVAGLAPSMDVLVAGRVLQGLGAGAVPSVAYATIGRSLPDTLRATDDGGPVDGMGRAGAGRPGDQRRGGALVRMALGVPGPAAGGRGGRIHRRARADPARAARGGSGAGTPADRRPAHRGRGDHAAGRPQPRGRVRRDPARPRADRGRRRGRIARAPPAGPGRYPHRTPRAARHHRQPGPADVHVLRRRRLRDPRANGGAPPQPGGGRDRGHRRHGGLDGRRLGAGAAQWHLGRPAPGPRRAADHPGRHRRHGSGAAAGRAGGRGPGGLDRGRPGHGAGVRPAVADDAAQRAARTGRPGLGVAEPGGRARHRDRHRRGRRGRGGRRGRRPASGASPPRSRPPPRWAWSRWPSPAACRPARSRHRRRTNRCPRARSRRASRCSG